MKTLDLWIKKLVIFLIHVETILLKLNCLITFIQIIHLFQLYFLINLSLFQQNHPSIQIISNVQIPLLQITNIFMGNNSDGSFSHAMILIPGIISLIGLVVFLGVFLTSAEEYKVHKYKKINFILIQIFSFLLILCFLGSMSFIFYIVKFFLVLGKQSYNYLVLVFPIFAYCPLLYFFSHRNWVFSFLFPIILILISVTNASKECIIAIGCLSIFFSLNEENLVLKIIYNLLISICGFETLRAYLQEKALELDLIFMALTYFFIIVSTVLYHTEFFKQKMSENKYLINVYKNLKGADLKVLNFKTIFQLQNIFIDSSPSSRNQLISKEPISKWENKTFFEAILLKLEKQRASTSREMDYFYFDFKLNSQEVLFQTLFEIMKFVQSSVNESKKNISIEYKMSKLQSRIEEEFYKKIKNRLEAYEIIELSELSTQFIKNAILAFEYLKLFWNNISVVKEKNEIKEIYLNVLKKKNKMEKILSKIRLNYTAQTEEKIFEMFLNLFTPYYNSETDKIIITQQKEIKYDSLSYIIIQNQIIVDFSLQFLYELEFEEEFFSREVRDLIPLNCLKFAFNNSINSKGQSLIILPLISKSKLMKLKKCEIMLYPKINCAIEYFLLFKPIKLDYDLFLLVNDRTNVIISINQESIEELSFSEERVRHHIIENEEISFVQLFELNENCKINKDQPVKCFCNFMKLQDKEYSQQRLEGQIILLEEYSKSYKLLGFKRLKNILQEQKKTKANVEYDYQKKAKNEKFFCPIPNPFKQKLEEKNRQLQEDGKKLSLTNLIIIFVILQFFLAVFLSSTELLHNLEQSNAVMQNVNNIMKSDNQKYELTLSFQLLYSQFLLCTREEKTIEHLLQTNSSYQFSDVVDSLKEKLHNSIHSFHQNFIHYRYRSYLDKPYNIQFQDFTVDANFKASNLIDFSYNIKWASETVDGLWQDEKNGGKDLETAQKESYNALDFALKNYKTMKSLEDKFESIDVFIEQMRKSTLNYMTLIVAIVAFCFIFIIVIFCLQWRIKSILIKIIGIFYLVDEQKIEKITENIEQIQSEVSIFKIVDEDFKTRRKKQKKLNNIKTSTRKKMIQTKRVQMQKKFTEADNKKEKEVEEKFLQRFSNKFKFYSIISENKFLLIFLCIISSIFVFYFFRMEVYLTNTENYLQYLKSLMKQKSKILFTSTDLLQSTLYSKLYNQTLNLTPDIIEKSLFISSEISNLFDNYNENELGYFRQSLCQNADIETYTTIFDGINCSKVFQGLLEEGYIQVQNIYESKIYQVLREGKDIFDFYDQNSQYIFFFEYLYVRSKIVSRLITVQKKLIDELETFSSLIETEGKVIFFLILMVLTLFCLYFFIFQLRKIKENHEQIKGYFQIVPRNVMENMKIVTYLRQNMILQQLGNF